LSLNLNVVVHSVDIEEGEKLVTLPGTAVPQKQKTAVVSAVLRSAEAPHVLLEVQHVDPAAFEATVTQNAAGHLELAGIKKGDAFTITLAKGASGQPAAPASTPAPVAATPTAPQAGAAPPAQNAAPTA
jgi:hypothetical protein